MVFSSDEQHSFSGLLYTGAYSRAVLREEVEEIFWRWALEEISIVYKGIGGNCFYVAIPTVIGFLP